MKTRDLLTLAKDRALTSATTLLLVWLHELGRTMADGKRVCWRSVGSCETKDTAKTLMGITGLSERQLRSSLKTLYGLGFVEYYAGSLFAANGEQYFAAKGVNVFELSENPAATLDQRRAETERRRLVKIAKDVPNRVAAAVRHQVAPLDRRSA